MEFITNFLLITYVTFSVFELVSTERYILHMQVLLECCYISMESWQCENWNHLFYRKLLWNICLTNEERYVPLVVNTFRSFPHSWLITGFAIRLTRRVSLVEQELLTFSEYLSSAPVFSDVRIVLLKKRLFF
jgi:hypothetical protein